MELIASRGRPSPTKIALLKRKAVGCRSLAILSTMKPCRRRIQDPANSSKRYSSPVAIPDLSATLEVVSCSAPYMGGEIQPRRQYFCMKALHE
ncbi:hypothetical protein Ae201684_009359 [Aphanomyces euteiches]|uniref:Uncharacterized protein n=1 Tax=Aphanomyces euteiches TaxID=100861 RepID=A0A6G0X1U2_9STRA|nr:hypothetical protein Ae201684_009359 [Aphanomyces euteiches]